MNRPKTSARISDALDGYQTKKHRFTVTTHAHTHTTELHCIFVALAVILNDTVRVACWCGHLSCFAKRFEPLAVRYNNANTQVGRANAFKARIERYLESTPVGLAFIARSSTKKEDEEEEIHKHCIGDVKG